MEQTLIIKMVALFILVTSVIILGLSLLTIDTSYIHALFPKKSSENISSTGVPIIPTPQPSPSSSIVAQKSVPTPTPISSPSSTNVFSRNSLYSLINAHRKEHSLSSLRVDTALELSSQRKLEEMSATNYWRHENQQGVINWNLFEQSGYHYAEAGENLSFGNNTPWDVFSAWLASPQHNEQLLKPEYEDMGIAVDCVTYQVGEEKNCAVVLHLGKKK